MSALDYAVMALYGVVVLAIGIASSRHASSASDLLLARRDLPTWAVWLSLVATELSAATFLGVPHAAYTGDWSYLELACGALIGKLVVAARVIPLYHQRGVVTVYGFLGERFGPRTRRGAAICFLCGRLLGSGVRLFIAALAFSTVTGVRIELAIAACGFAAGLYTLAGGLRAVVWTDSIQAGLFTAAAISMLVAIGSLAPAGWTGILGWAADTGRSTIFHTDPWLSLTSARPLGAALVGGFFLTLATHSTDHDMVQRLLATRGGRAGGRALIASALSNFPLTAVFLCIGTGLAYLHATPPAYDVSDARSVVAVFALHELPAGMRGLVFAGLFAAAMSSLDSAICALATTWVVDISPPTSAKLVARTRQASAGFAVLLMTAAWAMAAYQGALPESADERPALNLVELALSAMTVLYGGLLGVFALGIATRARGSDASALAGLASGAAAGLALFLHPIVLGEIWLGWVWWVPLSAAIAVLVGYSGSALRVDQAAPLASRS